MRGRAAADGKFVMTGNGISPGADSYGRQFDINFAGSWTGDRFMLRGMFGGRTCEVELARSGTASETQVKGNR